MKQDESQLDEHKKEEKDCSSKGETAQKHNSSHSKKVTIMWTTLNSFQTLNCLVKILCWKE